MTLECPNPFSSALARTSLSGVTGKSFCGIAEALTTCRAVLDLIEDTQPKPCTVDTDCGLSDLDDGLCRSIPGAGPAVCTYECTSGPGCPEEYHCPTGGGYCGQLE
ncbi:MAG: hypothetical protein H6714_01665 [Myxococcales bacterium]|nr:hypothetical protein [Myxococcales bacterium]